MTTHYLEEADELCTRVAIVDHGLVIAEGAPSELKAQIADDIIILGMRSVDEALKASQLLKIILLSKQPKFLMQSSMCIWVQQSTGMKFCL